MDNVKKSSGDEKHLITYKTIATIFMNLGHIIEVKKFLYMEHVMKLKKFYMKLT